MASLRDIRRRITSVRSTQKITRAMKLVAAAKLRRAQDNVVRFRPFAERFAEVVQGLVRRVADRSHPLLSARDAQQVLVLVFTSDRGLCGAFNVNALRAADEVVARLLASGKTVFWGVVGRKGAAALRFRKIPLRVAFPGVEVTTVATQAEAMAAALRDAYLGEARGSEGELLPAIDEVVVVYNRFRSAIRQDVCSEQLLPLEAAAALPEVAEPITCEPSETELLSGLLPLYVQQELHRICAESVASEYGARMTAMANATHNAEEMISDLTRTYNKARQSAITKELLEIVAGAEALRVSH